MNQLEYFTSKGLPSKKRFYASNEHTAQTYEKSFKYMTEDERLLAFSQDRMGIFSDCFILYAVIYCGVATAEIVETFLQNYRGDNWDLSMIKTSDAKELHQAVVSRLQALYSFGFLFRYRYQVVGEVGGKLDNQNVSLYIANESAYMMVKQRLKKGKLLQNCAMAYKPIDELIGMSATSYVMGQFMSAGKDVELLDRVFRVRKGQQTFYLPCEYKASSIRGDGTVFYVAGISGFWKWDKAIQTETDYLSWIASKIELIMQYLDNRTKKGIAVAVVVADDEEDLQNIADKLLRVDTMRSYLDRVFLTCEGVVRELKKDNLSMKNAFVRIVPETEGYHLESVVPSFIAR